MIKNISATEYHDDEVGAPAPTLSCSIAKLLLAEPPIKAMLAHPKLNPDWEGEDETSKAQDIGTAAHAMLLEGRDAIEVCPFKDWRTNDAKAQRDAARLAGKIPLLDAQYGAVCDMVLVAQQAAQDAGFNLATGKPEQSIVWHDGATWLKCRPDWLADDHDLILDYKATALSQAAWLRAIPGSGYDVQDALYRRGVEAETGKQARFVFMVQEVEAPHLCYFVELPAAYRAIGEQKLKKALAVWRACMSADQWPGYPRTMIEPDPLPWTLAEAEEIACELQGFTVEGFMFGRVPA